MAGLGSLVISLEANLASFESAMSKAAYQAEMNSRQIQKSLDGIHGTIQKVLGAAAGYVSIGAIWSGFSGAAESARTLELLSKRLDANVEDLSGLQYAAKKSGVEIESFNTGISRMIKNVSSAALGNEQARETLDEINQGSGKAAQALRELGLNAEVLNKLPLKDKLFAIAEAMKRVPVEGDKMRITLDLFGRGGAGMLTMLKQGGDGIERYINLGRQLGAVTDAEMTHKLAEASRSIKQANDAWHGMVLTLSATAAPTVKAFSDEMTRFLIDLRTGGSNVSYLVQTIRDLGKALTDSNVQAVLFGAVILRIALAAAITTTNIIALIGKVGLLRAACLSPITLIMGVSAAGMWGMHQATSKYYPVDTEEGRIAAFAGHDMGYGFASGGPIGSGRIPPRGPMTLPQNLPPPEPMLVLLQKMFPDLFTKPSREKPGGGGGGGANAGLKELMSLIDQLKKEYASLHDGEMAKIDEQYAHWINKIKGVEEVIKDPAAAQAEAFALAEKTRAEKKKKAEDDFNKWYAGATNNRLALIDLESNERLRKEKNIVGAIEKIELERVQKIRLAQMEMQSQVIGMGKGYIDAMAGAVPFLSQRLTLEKQSLAMQQEQERIALATFIEQQRLIPENQRLVKKAQEDELRGLLALQQQVQKNAQERKEWETQGAMGGLKMYAMGRMQEMETRGARQMVQVLQGAENMLGQGIGNAVWAALRHEKGGMRQVGQGIAHDFVMAASRWLAAQAFDLLVKHVIAPMMGEQIAKLFQTATLTAAATALTGAGVGLSYASVQQMTAAWQLQFAAIALKTAAATMAGGGAAGGFLKSLPLLGGLFHSGGVVRAHSGLNLGEVPIIAYRHERILSPSENLRYENGIGGAGGGGTPIVVNINHSPTYHGGVKEKDIETHGRVLVETVQKELRRRGKYLY